MSGSHSEFHGQSSCIPALQRWSYARHHFAYLKWEGELNMFMSFFNVFSKNKVHNFMYVPSWHKRLGARLPPLGSRVHVSVTPCGFHGGRNGVWVGFSRGFSRFPLSQISFHHFSILISSISFHFISPCDGASGMVGRHPCYSRTYNLGASSHLIPRSDLVLDTS